MSPDETQPIDERPPVGQAGGGAGGSGELTEDDLRAAYEAELSRLTTTDVMAQAVVSLLNLGARRLAPAAGAQAGGDGAHPERDLEQARDAIDAVRALLEVIERRIPSRELGPLRDALSRLQMAYAQEIGPGAPGAGSQPAAAGPAGPAGTEGPAGTGGPAGSGSPSGGAGPDQAPPGGPGQPQPGPGPAESSGRLWVPGR